MLMLLIIIRMNKSEIVADLKKHIEHPLVYPLVKTAADCNAIFFQVHIILIQNKIISTSTVYIQLRIDTESFFPNTCT